MPTALQDQQLAEQRIFTPQATDMGGSMGDAGAQGYWRARSGEIVFGAFTTNGMRVYTRKRMVPLMDYPQFTNDKQRGTGFDPMFDPYRLLIEAGGIKEFNRAQIVELGWHRKPHRILQAQIDRLIASGRSPEEALVTVIPQLEGFERVDVPCILCKGRVFNSPDELSSHEVIHRDDVQNRRLSESISSALAGGQAASTETMAPIVKMLAEAIQALSASQAETQGNLANTNALISRLVSSQETAPKSK